MGIGDYFGDVSSAVNFSGIGIGFTIFIFSIIVAVVAGAVTYFIIMWMRVYY